MPIDEKPSRNEDEYFAKLDAQLIKAQRERLDKERLTSSRTAHFMKCPKCGYDMKEENLEGVSVDRCTFCEGIYLDAGELDQIFLKKEDDRKGFFRKLVKI